jgi:hypothetical protein
LPREEEAPHFSEEVELQAYQASQAACHGFQPGWAAVQSATARAWARQSELLAGPAYRADLPRRLIGARPPVSRDLRLLWELLCVPALVLAARLLHALQSCQPRGVECGRDPPAGTNRSLGHGGYRTSGQECYVRYMPTRSRRAQMAGAADQIAMLSPSQVAAELGIEERTVRRWAAAGIVPAEHTPTGHHRLPATLVPVLQQLIKDKVPLNARTLRGRFDQQPQLKEVQAQPNLS